MNGAGRAEPNRNTLWARALADAWARLGGTHACVGSGSRCAPLVEAFAGDGRFHVHPHVDERSAAFFALGVGAASGRPAIVVTTSGTAAANLLPAVVEASQSEIPLLVVTADRPARLRGTDANQTIDQVDLFGRYPRLALDLAPPDPTEAGLRRLRAAAEEAWTFASQPPRGPVHLNLQFEKPLEPTLVAEDVPRGLAATLPRTADEARPAAPSGPGGAGLELAALIGEARRPLVVCGPNHDPAIGATALELAAALACPVVADPLSGARFSPEASEWTMAWADLGLSEAEVAESLVPDFILRVGRAPTSSSVCRYLGRHPDVRQVVIDPGRRWEDHLSVASEYLVGDPTGTLGSAAAVTACRTEDGWLARWRAVDTAIEDALAPALAEEWFEGAIAATIAESLPDRSTWFIGNSMPIRDVDAFAGVVGRSLHTVGFRGASGIDGNVSGAIGAAVARGEPAAALLGDLTLLHDVGALMADRPVEVPLHIIVIQNRGGGIFHMLPIRDYDPPFTPYVVMPQSVELDAVAAAARIPHRPVASLVELRAELDASRDSPGLRLTEVQIDRRENWDRREAIAERARTAGRGALTTR